MAKSLTNKIFLKEQLFGFKMNPAKTLEENLDEFKVITIELANADEKISDENQAIILLYSLPEACKDLKTAIKYDRSSLTLEDVLSALRSRDLEIKRDNMSTPAKGLHVSGQVDRNSTREKPMTGGSRKGPSTTKTCWYCKKDGHLRKECFKRKKDLEKNKAREESANLLDGYESIEAL